MADEKRVGAVVVLHDGKRVSWKASVSLMSGNHLGDRYFGPYKREECTVEYREFRGFGVNAWEQAESWVRRFPVSEWAAAEESAGRAWAPKVVQS
ncbi:MAG: hypothetical protein V1755_08675 [Chloroflexota bacterium]